MRLFCAVVLIVGLAIPVRGQDSIQKWSFTGSFSGSSNSDGTVTKVEPSARYKIDDHFSTYFGMPFYAVNLPSSTTTTTTTTGTTSTTGGFNTGLGNAFLGFGARVDNDSVNYSSTLEFTAPTGDSSQGFSTGRMTVDWNNRFSHKFSMVEPYASAGLANTVSDTAFFVRPFSTLGMVEHFEGGLSFDASSMFSITASAYGVNGSGEQRIISKVLPRGRVANLATVSANRGTGRLANRVFETATETVSQASSVNDHGYSGWFDVHPSPVVDFHAGYSRSVNYAFNTVFFGIAFHTR
jgi:hypothetical protein